jgi:uncharacterized RDD family membrane protein YckC
MNPSDVQSDTEPAYFDPEEIDMSEQQFAASLEIRGEKPQFEIDDVDLESEETRSVSVPRPVAIAESLAEAASSEEEACVRETAAQSVRVEKAPARIDSLQPPDAQPDWRNLVSAKVNNYKARKPQKDRYPSLKLQFDPPVKRISREREVAATFERVQEQAPERPAVQLLPTLPPEPQPEPPPRIVLEATARVIEFPRPAVRADELAEPVIDRPRIMEAPELLPPPPAMGGISMAPPQEPEPERRPGFDVPLQSAPLRQRIAAASFDAGIVALAMAVFGYVFIRINGAMPPFRSLATLTVGLLAVLWPAYQYAFLVFCGRTPGLRVARLHVSRFNGEPVPRRLRRWRVLASVLSLASLGLGYAWCFLDEDQLSWHDRITRTHLAP